MSDKSKILHAIVDFESLSNIPPDQQLVSVGISTFNEEDFFNGIKAPFSNLYLVFNRQGQEHLKRNQSTLDWWFGSNQAELGTLDAFENAKPGTVSLSAGINAICGYMNDLGQQGYEVHVWGNGATFDVSPIELACNHLSLHHPWDFRNVRDMRTLKDITHRFFGMKEQIKKAVPENFQPHNALSDSYHQGLLVMESLVLLQRLAKSAGIGQ